MASAGAEASNGVDRQRDPVMENRVSKVLQLRTESAAMFEALEAINEFYGDAYTVSQRHLVIVLVCQEAELVSYYFGFLIFVVQGNTSDARRTLRDDLEYQNIALVKRFLADFDQVKGRVDKVSSQLGSEFW